METMQIDTVHASESIVDAHLCPGNSSVDDLSKEKEDELLYGTGDDGDEEEALSDDSLRLRFSDDDELEAEEVCSSVMNTTQSEAQDEHTESRNTIHDTEDKSLILAQTSDSCSSKPVSHEQQQPDCSHLHKDEENKIKVNVGKDTAKDHKQEIQIHECKEFSDIRVDNKKEMKESENSKMSLLQVSNDKDISKTSILEDIQDNIRITSSDTITTTSDTDITPLVCASATVAVSNSTTITTSATTATAATAATAATTISTSTTTTPKSIAIVQHKKQNLTTPLSKESSKSSTVKNVSLLKKNTECMEKELISSTSSKLKNTITSSSKNVQLGHADESKKIIEDKDCKEKELKSPASKHKNSVASSGKNVQLGHADESKKIIEDKDCKERELKSSASKHKNTITSSGKNVQLDHADESKKIIEDKDCKERELKSPASKHKNSVASSGKNVQLGHADESKKIIEDKDCQNRNELPIQTISESSNINEHAISTDESSSVSVCSSLEPTSSVKTINCDNAKRNTQRKKRRSRKEMLEQVSEENNQEKENGRKKRKTAKNAEEIIRKKFLNHDSDLESSDSSDKFVIVNHKIKQDAQPLSPPSLKRNCPDVDNNVIQRNGVVKKIKTNPDLLNDEATEKEDYKKDIKSLNYVHKFCQRDIKDKVPRLKQEELEELLIQKMVETITMRSEMGKLREQTRISIKNQEATRARCQQLVKQIKDFEMVLNRNAADRRANNDKPTAPIKINRSVGLQVNFITESGMQNLRQLQQSSNLKPANITNGINTSTNESNNGVGPRRGLKIRSPRRSEASIVTQTITVSQSPVQTPALVSTVTPAALVVAKPTESQRILPLANQTNNTQQLLANSQPQQQLQQPQQSQQSQQPQQQSVLNGKLPSQTNRQSGGTGNVSKGKPNDLIDLTDEEEKSKSAVNVANVTTSDQQLNVSSKPQPCFQRMIQAIPGNVAIANQSTSIRVVQPASQPTPTALVNNMSAPRFAYVVQSAVGTGKQLFVTSTPNQIRPVTSCTRAPFTGLAYKGVSTIANGSSVRLIAPAPSNVQLNKHPAPLPDSPNYALNPVWKLPPPAPSLKISKVTNGIVLSWNMALSDKYAEIASYQLYAYQEVTGIPPSTALWKKVGDVRALPLPMACTLTQFSEGNNYYFAVRAVDTHSRRGQYSMPGNISL